jgi:hypothetical protein
VVTTHAASRNVWITGSLALTLSRVEEDIRVRARSAYHSHGALNKAVGGAIVRLENDVEGDGRTFKARPPESDSDTR